MIDIHLCVNDHRNGVFTGLCRAFSLDDSELLTLESPYVDRHLKCEIRNGLFRLGKSMMFGYHAHACWVGNWCWDMLTVNPATAADVLNFAIAKRYQVTVVSGDLVDKIQHGTKITARDLEKRQS